MGWTSVRDNRRSSALEMLEQHSSFYKGNSWTNKLPDGTKTREMLVEHMATGLGGVYGVLKVTDFATDEVYRMALVILVDRRGGEFYWKEMSEKEGPNVCFMPERLFRKLTPLDNFPRDSSWDYARDWRERVQKYLARKKLVVKPGDILKFPSPLTFQRNKKSVTLFQVSEWGKKKRFTALCDDGSSFLCRLSRDALTSDFVVNP